MTYQTICSSTCYILCYFSQWNVAFVYASSSYCVVQLHHSVAWRKIAFMYTDFILSGKVLICHLFLSRRKVVEANVELLNFILLF